MFELLEGSASTEALQALVAYIRVTWVTSNTWPPTCWSVFGQSVRTNNDVEGWHHALNARGRQRMPFYQLVGLLHEEAEQVQLTLRLVSDGKVRRHQKKVYADLHGKISTQWDMLRSGTKTVMQCLKALSRLYGPTT